MPIQDYLSGALVVFLAEFDDGFFFEGVHLFVGLLGEIVGANWSVSCYCDSQFLVEIDHLLLGQVGMDFNLVCYWLDFAEGEDI